MHELNVFRTKAVCAGYRQVQGGRRESHEQLRMVVFPETAGIQEEEQVLSV